MAFCQEQETEVDGVLPGAGPELDGILPGAGMEAYIKLCPQTHQDLTRINVTVGHHLHKE